MSNEGFYFILQIIRLILGSTDMIQYNCHYHPGNQLQNFCNNKQCSLPLCPKCIHPHLSQPQNHHLMSLDDIIAATTESVHTCLQGLQEEIRVIERDFYPENIHMQFLKLIEKYQRQNIEQINQYYAALKQEVLVSIKTVYSQNILPVKTPIEEKIIEFSQYLRDLKNDETVIPTLITINTNSDIQVVEKILEAFQTRKQIYKNSLPSLQPSSLGRLELIQKSTRKITVQDKFRHNREIYEFDHLSRIASLQDKLQLIRTRTIVL